MKATSHEFELFGCKFELGTWGVFSDLVGCTHVAPCRPDGGLLEPHQLDWDCACKPEWQQGHCAHRMFHVLPN